jgi:hypothetical protein
MSVPTPRKIKPVELREFSHEQSFCNFVESCRFRDKSGQGYVWLVAGGTSGEKKCAENLANLTKLTLERTRDLRAYGQSGEESFSPKVLSTLGPQRG